jgi:hypothetical protein
MSETPPKGLPKWVMGLGFGICFLLILQMCTPIGNRKVRAVQECISQITQGKGGAIGKQAQRTCKELCRNKQLSGCS